MLRDVARIIEEGHLGVRTYEKFVDACLERCAAGDEETVSLFALAKLVQPFCDYYADHALTAADADAFREWLLGGICALEGAGSLQDRHSVLREAITARLSDLGPPVR
jgi:hypothetical protein